MTSPAPETPLTRRQLREQQTPSRKRRVPRRRAVTGAYALKRRRPTSQRIFSVVALLFAAAFVIGTSVPASAFFGSADARYAAANIGGQSFDVSSDAQVDVTNRADYSVSSAIEQLAGARGGRYTPTTGAIRWPYPYATTITDGFGPRKSPCAGCSTFHKGTDFVPGAGVPTFAIAAGTVESSVVSNAGLGNEVIIDHGTVKGVHLESVYGHLQSNSSPLKAGDTVKVGDLVGKVGATGTTTGANMHLEIHVDGVAVDAFKWLTANATDKD